jgi:hypothetical protein
MHRELQFWVNVTQLIDNASQLFSTLVITIYPSIIPLKLCSRSHCPQSAGYPLGDARPTAHIRGTKLAVT